MIKLHPSIKIQAEHISLFIQLERERSDWTQKQLGYASHITRQTISQIERGKHEPHLSVLVALLEALGYDLVVAPRENFRPKSWRDK